jgi:peroxiredoxin
MVFKFFFIPLTAILVYISPVFAYHSITPKEPGDQVEDFSLSSFDGTAYTLGNFKNSKAVVIIFISTQCPYIQSYNERMVALTKEFSDKDITFLAINSNRTESIEDMKAQATANSYPFPVLKDYNNVVADIFGATHTPEVFVLDPNRVVLYHGRIDDSRDESDVTSTDLKNALNEIINGKEVAVKKTKSFGCSIKRVDTSK